MHYFQALRTPKAFRENDLGPGAACTTSRHCDTSGTFGPQNYDFLGGVHYFQALPHF